MERVLEASHLTTADVARRLGVQGGTVRHYGEILRARGYPFTQGENGEWLWAPEVAEVARGAYLLAKATPGLSFERALDLLEYAGRVALSTKPGTTLPEVLSRLDRLPERLSQVVPQVEAGLGEVVERVRGDVALTLVKAAEDLHRRGADLMRSISAKAEELGAATSRVEGVVNFLAFLPMVFLGVLALLLGVHALGLLPLPGWFPWVGVGLVALAGYLLGKVV
jgi:hypothetical protein